MKKKIGKMRGVLLLTFALFLTACGTGGADAQSASYGNSQAAVVERQSGSGENESTAGGSQDPVSATLDNIPAYSGTPYVVIDDNEPDFTEDELTDQSYESYSDLDELGRCGVASSNIGTDLMPSGKRGKIGQVKPSGWQTIKFDISLQPLSSDRLSADGRKCKRKESDYRNPLYECGWDAAI